MIFGRLNQLLFKIKLKYDFSIIAKNTRHDENISPKFSQCLLYDINIFTKRVFVG